MNGKTSKKEQQEPDIPGFIFEHLARNPRFDNVTRRPGYSRGPSGFLPVSTEGMSFFMGLFLEEKGTFGFLGALTPSKSPKSQKSLYSRIPTFKMTFPLTLEKSARSREYLGSSVTLSRRGAKPPKPPKKRPKIKPAIRQWQADGSNAQSELQLFLELQQCNVHKATT